MLGRSIRSAPFRSEMSRICPYVETSVQEMVVSRGWRLPDYSLASEAGPSHKKEFIICCSVEKLKEYGSGSSKKVAKRNVSSDKFISNTTNFPGCWRNVVKNAGNPIGLEGTRSRYGNITLLLTSSWKVF